MKVKLVEMGFDPGRIQDPLYILDDNAKSYVPLTAQIYHAIISGSTKLWAGSQFSPDVQAFWVIGIFNELTSSSGKKHTLLNNALVG